MNFARRLLLESSIQVDYVSTISMSKAVVDAVSPDFEQ